MCDSSQAPPFYSFMVHFEEIYLPEIGSFLTILFNVMGSYELVSKVPVNK